jgi:short-subunit dehydrogenase
MVNPLQASFALALLVAMLGGHHEVQALSQAMSTRGTAVIAGATGYIGKSVVRESVRQGYNTVALVRDLKKVQSAEGRRLYGDFFKDAQVVECDVSDPIQLSQVGIIFAISSGRM